MHIKLLSKMIRTITYDSLPHTTIKKSKLCIADFFGVLMAGKATAISNDLITVLNNEKDFDNVDDMALWIGSTARILDLDDGHRFAMGHPGVPILSSAISWAMNKCITGKSFIEAVVRGYEIYGYLGRVINPSSYQQRGFDSTGICGSISAAATVGSLMNLSEEKLSDAMAIAGSLCGGTTQFFEDGSSPKYLCAGWAAKLGIVSAKLAHKGFSGPNILDKNNGICKNFSPNCNLDHLNNPKVLWEIENVYLKIYGCVRRVQAALDCVKNIYKEQNLTISDIEKIYVWGGDFVANSSKYYPNNIVTAQSSCPFNIAILLTYGYVDLELIEKSIGEPSIDLLSKKVFVREDKELNNLINKNPDYWGASRVEIFTMDGRRFAKMAPLAMGEKETPFNISDLEEKFFRLSSKIINRQEAEDTWRGVMELEKCIDMRIFKDICK